MTISIEALTPRDRQRLLDVDLSAFFFDPMAYPADIVTSHFDWTRTFGATREGADGLVGVYTSYEMGVTVPGPLDTLRHLPMEGLSWVSVHPDHRRRGILREMVTHHLGRLREQGVILSGLHSAEAAIYGRFGYGTSSVELELELERGAVFTATSLDDAAKRVSTHFVSADSDESARMVHELQLRCAQVNLGAVTRPERMARPLFVDLPLARQGREPLRVLFAQVDGQPSGYAVFSRKAGWKSFTPSGTVEVTELAATDTVTLLALARRLVNFDLTVSVTIYSRGPDDPLIWWAGGPRAVKATGSDSLWLRLIDVGVALAARGYSSPCDVVLDVVDPLCPWNEHAWRLTVGADGVARCLPSTDDADVRLPAQALGAAYLGTRSLASQADLGLVTELTAGSLRPLSRAMTCDRQPVGAIGF